MGRLKLIRNLKKGDKFYVTDNTDGKNRRCLITVQTVQETRPGFLTGRRMWQVIADYPFWFSCGVRGYSKDKIEVIK